MRSDPELYHRIQEIWRKYPQYAPEAYYFVQEAVSYTVAKLNVQSTRENRHISGDELLEGVREYGLETFGAMTLTVFHEWGIRATVDFGRIVFQMVEFKLLGAQESDSIVDFEDGYDFETAFVQPFLPKGKAVTPPVIDD